MNTKRLVMSDDVNFKELELPRCIIQTFRRNGLKSTKEIVNLYLNDRDNIMRFRSIGIDRMQLIDSAVEKYLSTQKCRGCGCDQNHACRGGCYWVEHDLCSQCSEKPQGYSVLLRKVHLKGDEIIQDEDDDVPDTIADEMPSQDMAEGFIFGYAEGKGFEDINDEALDEDIEFEAIGISVWNLGEPVTEYFFKEVQHE